MFRLCRVQCGASDETQILVKFDTDIKYRPQYPNISTVTSVTIVAEDQIFRS